MDYRGRQSPTMAESASARGLSVDSVGPWELLIMLLAIGLLFGATRLSKLACSLGGGSWEFAAQSMTAPKPAIRMRRRSPGLTAPPAAR